MASGERFHEKEVDWRWRMQERRDEAVEMRSLTVLDCLVACSLRAFLAWHGMAWFLRLDKVPCPSFLRLRPWRSERYLVLFSALQRCSESSG